MEFIDVILAILNFVIVLLTLFLIGIILIQRGKGGGLAGAFGGVGGSSAFGTKTGDVFTKITVGVAIAWILLSMLMVVLTNRRNRLGLGKRRTDVAHQGARCRPASRRRKAKSKSANDAIGIPRRPRLRTHADSLPPVNIPAIPDIPLPRGNARAGHRSEPWIGSTVPRVNCGAVIGDDAAAALTAHDRSLPCRPCATASR